MKTTHHIKLFLLALLLTLGALALELTAQSDPPATPGEDEEPLETFVPSEQVSADSAISFPVDI